MYKIDKEKVRKILIEELGYVPNKADLFLKDYPPLHEKLGAAVEQWLKDRTVANVSIEGLSIDGVMEKQQTNFLVTVKNLNELMDESIPIEERKEKKEILNTQVFFE
ncbi:MAG: hypothetical protein MN733_10565 [Nitrososphaera sp.]|nr:hypothetical protein [Nitrososphaera sp.]